MDSTSQTAVPPRRRWDVAAVFVVIAALPPILMLGTGAGTSARVQAVFAGAKTAFPPLRLLNTELDTVAWAWAIFFCILAIIFGTDTEPEAREKGEPSGDGSGIALEDAETDVREPEGDGGDTLPVVPNVPEAESWHGKGNELYRLGRYEEATRCYEKALKLHPRFASAWAGKGLASNALGQYYEAIRCYDESLRLNPRNPAVWYDKGNSQCAVGRFEGALNCFNEALILDPRDARAWNNKGFCLASLGRDDEAIPCYGKALALDPSYAVAWHAKGLVEERLGRIPEAVEAYKQFIAFASDRDAVSVEKVRRHISALQSSV